MIFSLIFCTTSKSIQGSQEKCSFVFRISTMILRFHKSVDLQNWQKKYKGRSKKHWMKSKNLKLQIIDSSKIPKNFERWKVVKNEK